MATNFSELQMPDAVTVLVSTDLLAELAADWSPPVQIQVRRTPGIGSGYEMIARTHTCSGEACAHGVPAGELCKVCG